MALSSDPCKYFEMHQNISVKCCMSTFYLVHAIVSDRFITITMYYGRPMKPFFIEIPKFWAWADNLGK